MRLCVLQPPNKSWQRKQSRNRSLGGRKRNQQSQSWQNALAAQVDTRIFLPTKKRRKRDWQKKFTRQLFIFFIYLPFKNTGLKWVFLLLLQAHQKSKYILQFSLDFSKSVCREWKNKVTISISYSFHPHLIEIVLLLMSFIIIVRRGPVHLSAALVAAQLI